MDQHLMASTEAMNTKSNALKRGHGIRASSRITTSRRIPSVSAISTIGSNPKKSIFPKSAANTTAVTAVVHGVLPSTKRWNAKHALKRVSPTDGGEAKSEGFWEETVTERINL